MKNRPVNHPADHKKTTKIVIKNSFNENTENETSKMARGPPNAIQNAQPWIPRAPKWHPKSTTGATEALPRWPWRHTLSIFSNFLSFWIAPGLDFGSPGVDFGSPGVDFGTPRVDFRSPKVSILHVLFSNPQDIKFFSFCSTL